MPLMKILYSKDQPMTSLQVDTHSYLFKTHNHNSTAADG
jgi:hypothetical protein